MYAHVLRKGLLLTSSVLEFMKLIEIILLISKLGTISTPVVHIDIAPSLVIKE